MKTLSISLSILFLFAFGFVSRGIAQETSKPPLLFHFGNDTQEYEVPFVSEPPESGTFFSMKEALPPTPFNPFPELDVYSFGTDFYYDDRDYVRAETSTMRSMQQNLESDGPPSPGEGGGGDGGVTNNPPAFLTSTNLVLWPPVFLSSNSISLLATNTETNGIYDLFNTTNLAPAVSGLNLTNWLWLMRGAAGQTNFVLTNVPTSQMESYYLLGTMQDSDADGLTDAYEKLVSHTDPNNPDTDGDGISDFWELQLGTNPNFNESASSASRLNYSYGADGWLRTVSGAKSKSLILDNEANVLQIAP